MNVPEVEALLIARLAQGRGRTTEEVLIEIEGCPAIDSLEGIELAMEAEQAFGISIPDSELSSDVCQSLHGLATLVCSRLGSDDKTGGGARQ